MGYTEQVKEGDTLYTVEEFKLACEEGGFIDYDGFGFPVKDGLEDNSIWVKPSRLDLIPPDATYINWYNR